LSLEVLTVNLEGSTLLPPLLLKQCHNFHSYSALVGLMFFLSINSPMGKHVKQ